VEIAAFSLLIKVPLPSNPIPAKMAHTCRLILSHPARQGNVYERLRAAVQANMDVRFLTGLYYMPHRFPYSLLRLLPKHKHGHIVQLLEKRRIDGLDDSQVVSLLGPLLEMALRPQQMYRQWYAIHDWLASRWILEENRRLRRPAIFHGIQGVCIRSLRATKRTKAIGLLEVILPPMLKADLERWDVNPEELPSRTALAAEVGQADFFLTQSEHSVRCVTELGISEERIFRIHLGVDVRTFTPRVGSREPGPLRILFLGGSSRRKGVHHLLEVWRKHIGVDNVELIIGGNRTEGMEDLRSPSLDRCRVLGHIPDVEYIRVLQNADVLVQPSLAEGGCNVVYEALASGIPCIVTDRATSAVRDGVEGLVIPCGDLAALRAAMRSLCLDSALRVRMGQAARLRACSLTWGQFGERLASIYEGLAEYGRGADRRILRPLLDKTF
jgi:glycosyltransferase involved in cell wall biosynthesis